MTAIRSASILAADFDRLVPNGTWVRQLDGLAPRGVDLPIEGVLMRERVDDTASTHIHADTRLTVTPLSTVDSVRLLAGEIEYTVDGQWISFRELCIRATEQRLIEGSGMTLAQIGGHLYHVACWIEASGNKGYSDHDLMMALPAFPIRLLDDAYRVAWENILFFGEGGRRDDFNGWGVHKRTPAHWTIQWLNRFGLDHPQAEALMDAIWDEALAEHDKRAVKRAHKTYAGIDLEQALTRDVAHKAAAMWLLSEWADAHSWSLGGRREMWRLQSELYHMAHRVFRDELLYRQDQQPEKRRSKKKTQAARDDWAAAGEYFGARSIFGCHAGFYDRPVFNAHKFYTVAYVKACCASDHMPDASVDFDTLPRGTEGELPTSNIVATMSETDEEEV